MCLHVPEQPDFGGDLFFIATMPVDALDIKFFKATRSVSSQQNFVLGVDCKGRKGLIFIQKVLKFE